jgi:hypothetical protein
MGTFLRWNGSAWAPSSPLPRLNLLGITAFSPQEAYAVGVRAAARWDGTRWTDVSAGLPVNTELYSLYGSSAASNLRAVGSGVFRWTGSAWAQEPGAAAGSTAYLGIHGTGPSDVWMVGRSAARHFNGTTWSSVLTGVTVPLYGVWGSAPDNFWAVGEGGTIVHWDGAAWSPVMSPTQRTLRAVWGPQRG